jgi:hypothetical protein
VKLIDILTGQRFEEKYNAYGIILFKGFKPLETWFILTRDRTYKKFKGKKSDASKGKSTLQFIY